MNTQYNIPTINLQSSGRQNRVTNDIIEITPHTTYVCIFNIGNQDGVPILLHDHRVKFLVWNNSIINTNTLQSEKSIILNKDIFNDDPYSGKVKLVLSPEDTFELSKHNHMVWSLVLIDGHDNVYPLEVSTSHGKYGDIKIDTRSNFPSPHVYL